MTYEFRPGTTEHTVELGTQVLWCLYLDGPFVDERDPYYANANELLQAALRKRKVTDRRVSKLTTLAPFVRKLASEEFGHAVDPTVAGKRTLAIALGIDPSELPPAPEGWNISKDKDPLAGRRTGNFLWPAEVAVNDRMHYAEVLWTLWESGPIDNPNAAKVLRHRLEERGARLPNPKLGQILRNLESDMFGAIVGREKTASFTSKIWLNITSVQALPPNPFKPAPPEAPEPAASLAQGDEFDEFMDEIDDDELIDVATSDTEGSDLDEVEEDPEDEDLFDDENVPSLDAAIDRLLKEEEEEQTLQEMTQTVAPQLFEPPPPVPKPGALEKAGVAALARYDEQTGHVQMSAFEEETPIGAIAATIDMLGVAAGMMARREFQIRSDADARYAPMIADLERQLKEKDELIAYQQAALVNRGQAAVREAQALANGQRQP